MDYPVNLLTSRPECLLVLAETQADIDRMEFRITATTRSTTLQTGEATANVNEINSLTEQIVPLEARIATMAAGQARTKEEVKLRSLKRDREELQDEQLTGQGGRGAIRRARELDAAQRQLAGYLDCKAQVQKRHDELSA